MTNEDCIKNNVCPFCEGKIYFEGHKGGKIKCTCEDGTYIGNLLHEQYVHKTNKERDKRDYKLLQDWVKEKSKCETCGGDQCKTFGLMNCKECGIPGTGYWPG